jgi:hypothetical protein
VPLSSIVNGSLLLPTETDLDRQTWQQQRNAARYGVDRMLTHRVWMGTAAALVPSAGLTTMQPLLPIPLCAAS